MMPCNRRTKSSLTARAPSTMPLKGDENQYENSFLDLKMCGIKKCIKDHSSIKLFCSGVPVNKSRRALLKVNRVCQRIDLKFLMLWASSKMR